MRAKCRRRRRRPTNSSTRKEIDPEKSQNGPWSAGIPGLPAALVAVP